MREMIEHMFGDDKFGAEFPSAAQTPISLNSLCNVHSTISRADTARRPSVTSRTILSIGGRSGTAEAGGDAVLGRLVAGAGAGGETGDAGQRLMEGGASSLPARPHRFTRMDGAANSLAPGC